MSEQKQLSINIAPDKAQGVFANLALIAHTPTEFVLDFAQLMPGIQQANVVARVVVTPDQDPSFNIAGKGEADAQSMRQAIYMAVDMFRHRADYDAPLDNPLPKLYHEKREDGDKARFAVRAKDQFKTPPEK